MFIQNRSVCLYAKFAFILAAVLATAFHADAQSASGAAQKPAAKKAAPSAQRKLSQDDVKRLWTAKSDLLLTNQIRLRGLSFVPQEDWVNKDLPTSTGVPLSAMPNSAAQLKSLIESAPSVDQVTSAAPGLLEKVKVAAQKRDSSALDPLLHPDLAANRAKVYDLFDIANYRGHNLGKYAEEPNREVSVQFFQLTASGVETVHYVYFMNLNGNVVLRDVKSGPEEAERFLKDEEQLAQSKLQLMFRALNDGDDAGVKLLCSDGLYEAIKNWGGNQHPGDRLTRGHALNQVTVKTSVPLDQKSVHVVATISYPLTPGQNVEFYADFERINNDLKIVRVRDMQNKYIVFDPNAENYLNRRYGLPDGPVLTEDNVPMTEQEIFLSLDDLRKEVRRVLVSHDTEKIKSLAQTFIDSNPTGGEGFGIRTAADQMLAKYEDASKDASRALQLKGTVYVSVEKHAPFSNETFTPAVLGLSRDHIEYIPAPGHGARELIDIKSAQVKFDNGTFMLKGKRPFLSLQFTDGDGKKKTYNLAALGTSCSPGRNLIPQEGGEVCPSTGSAPITSGQRIPVFGANQSAGAMVYVPEDWQENLMMILTAIREAKGDDSSDESPRSKKHKLIR